MMLLASTGELLRIEMNLCLLACHCSPPAVRFGSIQAIGWYRSAAQGLGTPDLRHSGLVCIIGSNLYKYLCIFVVLRHFMMISITAFQSVGHVYGSLGNIYIILSLQKGEDRNHCLGTLSCKSLALKMLQLLDVR